MARTPKKRPRKAIDGRTSGARRLRDLIAGFTAEIGGGDLAATEAALIHQAAALTLRAEQLAAAIAAGEPGDDSTLIRLNGAARRSLTAIAKRTKPATTETLPQYLARRAAEQAAAADDEDED